MATLAQTQILRLSAPTRGNIIAPADTFFIRATRRVPYAGESRMTPERWQQAKAIFQRAIEMPPDERLGFVTTASAGDEMVAAEVALLLEAHGRTDGFSLSTKQLPGLMATTEAAVQRSSRRCPRCGLRYGDDTETCPIDGEFLVEDPADLSGTLLDTTYRVLRVLGRGGMGVVYLAEHVLLHDRVAIKVLPDAALAQADSFRRFLREGQMARAIRHPHVVSVLELRTTADGLTYMVLEYVEGPTLRDELRRRGRLSLDEAVRLLAPIASALDHAHGLGIVHRDLKPENVIIGGRPDAPVVKLLDLGLARLFDAPTTDGQPNMTTAGQILGTPAYMPPEQWGQLPEDGGSSIDARTDIYSLGVMLVEMVAGRPPFVGKTLHELRVAHAMEAPPRLSDLVADVPESASEAVSRALSKDRSGRQASAGQFLAEVRGGAAPLAPTVAAFEALDTRREEAPPAAPSIRWQWIAAVAVLLVAVACVVAFFGMPPFGAKPGGPLESRPAAAAVDARTVSVRLLAQRSQDGVTRVESFAPGDDIVFGNGDGVRLEAETSHSGYVYFINEAPTLDPATALPRYTVIFPKPGEGGGAVPVKANAVVRVPEHSWIEFFGTAGRETVWVVWSAKPVAELRDVETLVTPEQLGRITDPAKVESVRRFLASTLNVPRPARSTSTGQSTTHEFATSGDVIVFPLYFEHR